MITTSPSILLGNRGLLREVWTSTKVTDLSSIGNLNSKSRDYHYEVVPDASSRLLKPSFGEKKWFSSRLRGFFVAPSDNTYTFYIQADDKADLYLSLNSSASSKVFNVHSTSYNYVPIRVVCFYVQ